MELARSCRAYAELVRGTWTTRTTRSSAREAAAFAKRADDIFAKLKLSSYGLQR